MSWRDRTGAGSFRGVPFHVDSIDREGGRRVVEHAFPGSEIAPYTEDTGRRGRTVSIECYVLGDDYLDQRDALLDALETPGPGELIHPAHGTLQVVVSGYRVREEAAQGGRASFTLACSETSTPLSPSVSAISATTAATAVADSAQASAGTSFLDSFDPSGPLAAATGAVTGAADSVRSLSLRASLPGQALASLLAAIDHVSAAAGELLATPETLVAELSGIYVDVAAGLLVAGSRLDSVLELLALLDADLGEEPAGESAASILSRDQWLAVGSLARASVIVGAARVAVEIQGESYEQALMRRDAVIDRLDTHLETLGDSYGTWAALRAALVRAVPSAESSLPHLRHVTLSVQVPSLVLAQRLDGDLARHEDLVARNRLRNPLAVPAGVELEVLGD